MPILPSREPVKLRPRGDFDEESFRRLVFQLGARMVWEERAQCPCGRKSGDNANDMSYGVALPNQYVTGEPQPECPLCKGIGFYLHSSQNIKAIVQDQRVYNQRFNNAGEYGAGTARVTFLPEHKPALGDRLTAIDSVLLVRETKLKSASATEWLRFPIASQALDVQGGPTTYKTLRAHKADSNNNTTSNMSLVEGVDYVVNNQGQVDWTLGIANGHVPALNTYYTMSYYIHPRYVVVDHHYGIRDTFDGYKFPEASPKFQTLPVCAIVKMEWLGLDGGPP